jgi:diadenosine tetraphosphate (Ap4A) HIT family hydrolase
MENLRSNPNSHLTAIQRTSLSFPARILLGENVIQGEVLDYGCGIGKDVELLQKKGFKVDGFDPHYFPKHPEYKYDTILCIYVLNVLLPHEQRDVLMNVSNLLKNGGKAYFAVRRDITFEGYRTHKLHKQQTYQCQVNLPFKSVYKNENCEIYEYTHYTTLNHGDTSISPFFSKDVSHELISESLYAFSFYDLFPVSKGHALVVPKRLVSNYFDLSWLEQQECWKMVNKVKSILQEKYNPDGFNIGINVNEAAGQTIFHCHIHIIPRYNGDHNSPRGGVRAVIPSKKEY